MYLLNLYHVAEPDRALAARMIADGRIRVGRDPAADWVIADPDCEVSRTHLELVCSGDALVMTPLGANGVFSEDGTPLPNGKPQDLASGDAIRFGSYRLEVRRPAAAGHDPLGVERTIIAAPFGANLDIARAWPEPAPARQAGDSLLDAFCRGADLDTSAFSGADPEVVLERAGEIYRQMVLGLSDLMGARSTAKQDHRLDHTRIGAQGNNPFKWAASRRLAADLLLHDDPAFQRGPEAIRSSVADVKKHMLATLEGFHAVIAALLEATEPNAIEARVKRDKSLLQSQAAACWAELHRMHGRLANGDGEGSSGILHEAFAAAYKRRMDELGGSEVDS